ncbi:hypothetical protein N7512_001345 [Penicillium capsulatum]|nr:hypothetical protein N7512_001345 [Penicillium capsulatum]
MADLDQDISPIPRSREENQERAFIAASRRKDRSLDARLESANRASMLHKKRTGKAFHITKEIVEKEAMYEEVDERYQEKRIRMLQAQNMQIEEQFHRHLLAAFAARANSSGSGASSIASRRASLAHRASVDAGSSRKMSLDLSNLQTPYPQGMGSSSMPSPMTAGEGYIMSPTSFDSNAQSYMTCVDSSGASPYNMATTATSTAQAPAYLTQDPASTWATPMAPSWVAMQQHAPTPNQTPSDAQAVHMWQQQMVQQAQMPTDAANNTQMRQFRDRLASAPELPVQQTAPLPHPAASISGPSHGHSRGQSQPSNNFHNLHLLTQSTTLAHMASSSNNSSHSPRIESLSAETQSTPDFCPTPNTPLSPTTVDHSRLLPPERMKETLDPDYNEFTQYAMGLDQSSHPFPEHETYGIDDFVMLDEFVPVAHC